MPKCINQQSDVSPFPTPPSLSPLNAHHHATEETMPKSSSAKASLVKSTVAALRTAATPYSKPPSWIDYHFLESRPGFHRSTKAQVDRRACQNQTQVDLMQDAGRNQARVLRPTQPPAGVTDKPLLTPLLNPPNPDVYGSPVSGDFASVGDDDTYDLAKDSRSSEDREKDAISPGDYASEGKATGEAGGSPRFTSQARPLQRQLRSRALVCTIHPPQSRADKEEKPEANDANLLRAPKKRTALADYNDDCYDDSDVNEEPESGATPQNNGAATAQDLDDLVDRFALSDGRRS
ncbi:hypothetical protein SISNIDRAFT_491380 [Sistotremastrum niveocremeum HHB9708]|uniref:Uncharacterized protein n=1 Tax=Sistotremastrum niveocremeum HHB9708 TaxID=1314777 RepID=A0A164MVY2_9AGAM|nr:hypothetical protein SISNIDRAFT_491380 [Sistotremastrum niveocremeum HHB9708]